MTFLQMPEIETERLLLRKIKIKDAQDMYEYAKNPNVSKYLTWSAHESLSYTKKYIKFLSKKYIKGEYFDWGIELKQTGKFIGTCGFSVFDSANRKAEIGYVLNPAYHNNGYATEAVLKIIDFTFNELNFHRIEARCILENAASSRVLEKCGLILEGICKDELFLKNEYKTIKHYAIINR